MIKISVYRYGTVRLAVKFGCQAGRRANVEHQRDKEVFETHMEKGRRGSEPKQVDSQSRDSENDTRTLA